MNYYYYQNKVVAYNDNVVEEKPLESGVNVEVPFCLDEASNKLFLAIKSKNYKVDGGILKVGRSKIKLLDSKPPKFEFDNEEINVCPIDLDKLKEAFKFVSKSNTRATLMGVYIDENGTIIASDSFKIFYYSQSQDIENPKSIILSPELIKELIKYNGVQMLEFNSRLANVIINDDIVISGKLLVGEYPNIFRLLDAPSHILDFDQERLDEIIKLGSLVESTSGKRLIFNEDNTISISAYEEESNELIEELATSVKEKIAFNYDGIKTCIGSVGKNYTLLYNESTRPFLLESEDETTKCVLLPIRV